MKYVGSKARYAKQLLPIIHEGRKPGQWYVEPFCGGANMIDKVSGKRLANDNHPYLIALLQALSEGWLPPERLSEQEYYAIKSNPDSYPKPLVGFAGFCCSYSGKWWGGFARDRKGTRDHTNEAYRHLKKQNLSGIDFRLGDYRELLIPDRSIVYCDIPYRHTLRYHTDFDHEAFWAWAREQGDKGHKVYVSEYTAPEDWVEVWSKPTKISVGLGVPYKTATEKLFIRPLAPRPDF